MEELYPVEGKNVRLSNVRGVDVLDEMTIEELLAAVRRIHGFVRLMVSQPLLIPDVLARLEEEFANINERFKTKERVKIDVDLPEVAEAVSALLRRRADAPPPPEPPPTIDPDSDEAKAIWAQLERIAGTANQPPKRVDVILPVTEEKAGE